MSLPIPERALVPMADAGEIASAGMARLSRGLSLEATRPSRAELEALARVLAPGTSIYLSAPPAHPATRLAELAVIVRAAGFDPVPHVAARGFADLGSLAAFLARLRGEAGVTRVLAIAGDLDRPAGPLTSALDLIESDLLQRHGVVEVAVAGYPDGHPKIGRDALASALAAKLEALRARGLSARIVSQFCFDAARILGWLRSIRACGIDCPVTIGLAGPTSMRALLRYALRCGVSASLKGMVSGKALQLLGETTPEPLVRALAEAHDWSDLGPLSLHLFSFGGLVHTAQWTQATLLDDPRRQHVARAPRG